MFDKARYNSLFYMYSGRAKRGSPDQLRGDCGVVHDRIYFRQEDSGATSIEYGLIAALTAAVGG